MGGSGPNGAVSGQSDGQVAPSPSGEAQSPVIPWQHRRQIGRARAYWRTLCLVIRRNGRLGEYLNGPVDERDARRFRLVTVILVMVPSIAMLGIGLSIIQATVVVAVQRMELGTALSMSDPLVAKVLSSLVTPLCIGAVSWFFYRRRQDRLAQDRAIALSCYTCAPLALLPLALIPPLLTYLLMRPFAGSWGNAEELLGSGSFPDVVTNVQALVWSSDSDVASAVSKAASGANTFALVLWVYWYQLILFSVRSIARRRARGIVLTAVALPVAWTLIDLAVDWVAVAIVMTFVLVPSV